MSHGIQKMYLLKSVAFLFFDSLMIRIGPKILEVNLVTYICVFIDSKSFQNSCKLQITDIRMNCTAHTEQRVFFIRMVWGCFYRHVEKLLNGIQ